MDEYTVDCPPGLYRLFITRQTQQIFNLKTEEDVTQEDNIKSVKKQSILDDIANRHALSDFSPLKKQIEDYPDEDIYVIYDYEFQHDKNFYLCLDTDLKEFIENVHCVFYIDYFLKNYIIIIQLT